MSTPHATPRAIRLILEQFNRQLEEGEFFFHLAHLEVLRKKITG